MTEITKTKSYYTIKDSSKSSLHVQGSANVREDKVIESLNLSFMDGDNCVGTMSYSEYTPSASYSYTINDISHKEEIMSSADAVIADVKEQIATQK